MKKFYLIALCTLFCIPTLAQEPACLKSDFWKTLGGDDLFPFSRRFDSSQSFDRSFLVAQKGQVWSFQDHADGLTYVEVVDFAGTIKTGVAIEAMRPQIYIGALNFPFQKVRFEVEIEKGFIRLQNEYSCEYLEFKIIPL